MPEPASWPLFCAKVRMHAPACPLVVEEASGLAAATGVASSGANYAGAAASGAGHSLPTGVGAAFGVADAVARGNPGAAATAVGDEAIGLIVDRAMGGVSGTLVSGLLMLLRGAHTSLERSDATASYLLDLSGYLTTLVRSAQRARAGGSEAAVIPPLPRIPAFVEASGALYSRFNRDAYLAGYSRVGSLLRRMDEDASTPDDPASRQCLRHLAEQAGIPGARDLMLVARDRAEDYIARRMLQIDRRALAERLRRWANAG